MIGGFLAPVLISSGGSHVMLFSYYAILNGGILAIAWFKAWRELNLAGFVFTFIIGSAWGYRYYQPEFFPTTEPFLVSFFLFYVAVPVLFALRAPPHLKGFVDGPLIFGVPLVAAALQAALVHEFEYGLAISAFVAGLFEIWEHVASDHRWSSAMVFIAASALACGWLAERLSWDQMRYPPLLLLPFMALTAVASFTGQDTHPLAAWGAIAWPLALAAHYRLLWRYERPWPGEARLLAHAGGLWLTLFLGSWELAWQAERLFPASSTWPLVAWLPIPLASVQLISVRGPNPGWPIGRWFGDYVVYGLGPVVLYLIAWLLYAGTQAGDPRPLPYIPLINPIELLQIAALIATATWSFRALPSLDDRIRVSVLAALGFVVLNTIIGRSTHFLVGVPYTLRDLYASAQFQTATSITWTVTALILTVLATRRGSRDVWLAGIGLLILVVVKLFLIDLAGVGTIARIVSFIVVGILILVVAYLSPLPPARGKEHQT